MDYSKKSRARNSNGLVNDGCAIWIILCMIYEKVKRFHCLRQRLCLAKERKTMAKYWKQETPVVLEDLKNSLRLFLRACKLQVSNPLWAYILLFAV